MSASGHEGRPRAWRRCVAVVVGSLAGLSMVLAAPSGPAAAGPAEDAAFVRALYRDFLDDEPTSEQLTHFVDQLASGRTHLSVAVEFALGITNLTAEVEELYRTALGRAPDDDGLNHWFNMYTYAHRPFSWVTARVYGSPEYVWLHGGAPDPWAGAAFADILGRAPDAASRAYWGTVAATKGPAFAALRLYQSPEHRRTRAATVFTEVLGRAPDPDALAFWSAALTPQRDDLRLAARLAASDEYRARAVARFP